MIQSENVQDELFCLQFENRSLAELLFYNHSERWLFGFQYPSTEKDHLCRYEFAKQYANNKRVLDIACGCGYGSYLLAKEGNANEVTGVDLNEDSVRYGSHRYKHPKVKQFVGDATEYTFGNKFDLIVSFETIEHIPDYEKFLKNIEKALADDGILLISSPIVTETTTKSINPYHVIEWSMNDFISLINKYFVVEDVYVQSINLIQTQVKQLSIYKRILRKFGLLKSENKTTIPNNPVIFEKFENQFSADQVINGYQVAVCKKANK